MDENIPAVQSDRAHFVSILDHLLSNAVKFSPAGGRIGVSARMDEKGDLWLQVNDHGQGMPDDQISVAMAPFGRAAGQQASPQADPFCAGLGLPLAQRLAPFTWW